MFTPNYELKDVRVGAKIVSDLLLALTYMAEPGMNVLLLEEFAESFIKQRNASALNKGYQPAWASVPFKSILCVNINNEAVHTPARNYILQKEDIVHFDVGIKYRTGCADAATTVYLGEHNARNRQLLKVTEQALHRQISMIKPGANTDKIGIALDKFVRSFGMRVIKGVGGHRIGEEMHLSPFIPSEGGVSKDFLETGMVLCLEPIITYGSGVVTLDPDGWTRRTVNHEPVAQFESMVLVTKEGFELLTHHI